MSKRPILPRFKQIRTTFITRHKMKNAENENIIFIFIVNIFGLTMPVFSILV